MVLPLKMLKILKNRPLGWWVVIQSLQVLTAASASVWCVVYVPKAGDSEVALF